MDEVCIVVCGVRIDRWEEGGGGKKATKSDRVPCHGTDFDDNVGGIREWSW